MPLGSGEDDALVDGPSELHAYVSSRLAIALCPLVDLQLYSTMSAMLAAQKDVVTIAEGNAIKQSEQFKRVLHNHPKSLYRNTSFFIFLRLLRVPWTARRSD